MGSVKNDTAIFKQSMIMKSAAHSVNLIFIFLLLVPLLISLLMGSNLLLVKVNSVFFSPFPFKNQSPNLSPCQDIFTTVTEGVLSILDLPDFSLVDGMMNCETSFPYLDDGNFILKHHLAMRIWLMKSVFIVMIAVYLFLISLFNNFETEK